MSVTDIFEHRVGSLTAMTTANVSELKFTATYLHISTQRQPFLFWIGSGNIPGDVTEQKAQTFLREPHTSA
jgi:hypothetical protein